MQAVGPVALVVVVVLFLLSLVVKRTVVGPRPLILPETVTDRLYDEPPAIAEFLVNGFRPGIPAVSATIVDLAARGMLRVEPGAVDYVNVRVVSPPEGLLPYERLVYDTVAAHARDGVASGREVRKAFLRYGMWSRFCGLVVDDVIVRGLATPRRSRLTLRSVKFDLQARQTPTDAGTAAAARWFGVQQGLEGDPEWRMRDAAMVGEFGRRLAYAAALGRTPWIWLRPAPGASRDATHAWSDHGGRWREVRILRPRFTHLTRPPRALLGYLPVTVAVLALALWALGRGGALLVPGIVAAAVGVRLLVGCGRIARDILRPRYIRGLVIRVEPLPHRRWRRLGDTSWVVIDRGRLPWSRGIRFDPATAPELRPGDHVRAHVAAWTCWAHEIVPVGSAR
jgi:hypothetical protein